MSKINKIKLSGTTYDVEDANASKTVELTQAQYDALVQSGTVDPNTFYIITDAQAVDISEYWTSGQTQSAIDSAVSGKQDTLSAGTGIDITNNVISATGGGGGINSVAAEYDDTGTDGEFLINVNSGQSYSQIFKVGSGLTVTEDGDDVILSATGGGGGGKAVSGGTNISITTGETADTINCTLPITATSNVFNAISVGAGSEGGTYNTLIGPNAKCDTSNGHNVFLVAKKSNSSSNGAYVNGTNNVIIGSIKDGYLNFSIPSFTTSKSVVIGGGGISTDKDNSVAIGYLANVSGTTQTNINNQLTIDTSNQVYIYNKDNTEMICLQDQLGGGGASYSAGTGIDITNNVISVSGVVETSAITTSVTSSSTDSQVPSAKAVYDIVGDIETLLSQI